MSSYSIVKRTENILAEFSLYINVTEWLQNKDICHLILD